MLGFKYRRIRSIGTLQPIVKLGSNLKKLCYFLNLHASISLKAGQRPSTKWKLPTKFNLTGICKIWHRITSPYNFASDAIRASISG